MIRMRKIKNQLFNKNVDEYIYTFSISKAIQNVIRFKKIGSKMNP